VSERPRGDVRVSLIPEIMPGTKISTLKEMFEFVDCATDDPVLFNIESKVDGDFRNLTRTPEEFVAAMGKIFVAQGEAVVDRITHQSFDVSSEGQRSYQASYRESLTGGNVAGGRVVAGEACQGNG